ncbi:hypothetical protein NUACC21_50450 [Scytonema sp. NUACC21]
MLPFWTVGEFVALNDVSKIFYLSDKRPKGNASPVINERNTSLTPSLPHSLTPPLPHSLTLSLPHSLTPPLPHSFPQECFLRAAIA